MMNSDDCDNAIIMLSKEIRSVQSDQNNKIIKARIDKNIKLIQKNPTKQIFKKSSIKCNSTSNYCDRIIKDDQILTGQDACNEVHSFFSQLSTSTSFNQHSMFLDELPFANIEIEPDFSIENIRYHVNKHFDTAPGPSNTTWSLLKSALTNDTLANRFSTLFQNIFNQSKCPISWKHSTTILLQKEPNNFNIDNWRPISLLSVEYKLFSHILNSCLINNIIENKLIPPEQIGFLPNRDVTMASNCLIDVISNSIFNKTPLFTLFIDFKKAFDSISHHGTQIVLQKMKLIKTQNMIKELYSNATTTFNLSAGTTKPIMIERGVRQGDVISPTLFIVYLAPLLWKLKRIKSTSSPLPFNHQAYADDLVLLSNNENDLIQMHNTLISFSEDFSIAINPKKSGIAWNSFASPPPHLFSSNISQSEQNEINRLGSNEYYKYLGIHLNLNLNWERQITILTTKLSRIAPQCLNKKYFNMKNKSLIIKGLLIPSLSFSMQSILYPTHTLSKWTQILISPLRKSSNRFSTQMAHIIFNIPPLRSLNTKFLISSIYQRLLITPIIHFRAYSIGSIILSNNQHSDSLKIKLNTSLNENNLKLTLPSLKTPIPWPNPIDETDHAIAFTDGGLSFKSSS